METLGKTLELADQLNEIADEMLGVARILWIMYEYEICNGSNVEHLPFIAKTAERHSDRIKEIAREVHPDRD